MTDTWRIRASRQRLTFLLALLVAATALYLLDAFWRTDLALYDAGLPSGRAPSDVVIVAIDDPSIQQLGRWPWPRATHAALLDRLRAAGARAVALDILFTEPDPNSPEGDAALAAAMSQGLPTVLPLLPDLPGNGQPARELLPIPILAQAAAGLGHADLEIDPDGIVRSVFLREGPGAPTREYLTAVLLERAPGGAAPRLSGERRPATTRTSNAWERDYRLLIPFLGPAGHFAHVSYVDVLHGTVDPAVLRGKLVLVGATAQAVGDAFATPRSGHSQPMPGIEIAANILQALRTGTAIRRTPTPITILLGLLPIALVAVGLQRMAPRQSLLLAIAGWFAVLAFSVLLPRFAGWWWPPTATLAVLLVAYPLWSWRRLEATQAFLEEEFRVLARESFPLLAPRAGGMGDFVEHRIELLRQAITQLRAAQREREDVLRFLSHDMKSPAASLLGLAQIQRDPTRALPPAELSQRLDLLAQRMLTLVDSFVALARAEAVDPATFDQFDLKDAVQDAYDEVWAAAQARDIAISIHSTEDACVVSGDRHLLARAVINLLSNAIKFAPRGSGVEIFCERADKNAVIGVLDHGPGVEPERRSALFHRFSRGVRRGTDPGGAGLGLAFVRVVAEKHRGRAWAEHELARGVMFRVSVPTAE
jgi:CHASE2 domain-containing sensor protein/two-component sensor histidine kinase